MPTVTHPRIPTYTVQVSDTDLDRWLAQGWLPPAPPDPSADVTPTPDPGPAPTPPQRRPRRTKKEN